MATPGITAFAANNPATKKEGLKTTFDEIQTGVNTYIKELGMFGKLALVNELKKKADYIISILKSEKGIHSSEVESIASSSGVEIRTVLTKYVEGIRKLPEDEEPKAIQEIIKMVELVKNTSISDLKTKFS